MKTINSVSLILALGGLLIACSPRDRYLDLTSGEYVEIDKDEKTGVILNKETGEPLYIYVDTKTDDTIYARTGEVINGHVVEKDGKYLFDGDAKLKIDDDGSYKYKDGDYKRKVDEDGDRKIKNGDRKVKIDGETGERKVKND